MQSSLSILVDEKRVNELLKQKTGAKAFIKSGCNLAAFVFFIWLFTWMALGEPLALHRSFKAYIFHRFDLGSAMRLDEVNSVNDFYEYWNTTMIPGLYSNSTRQYTFPGAQIQSMLKIDGSKANNRLFGLVRVRMASVKDKQECKVQSQFESYFPDCYGGYDEDTEYKGEFGPVSPIGGPMFEYTEDTQSFPHDGWLGSYGGGGYLQVMYGNYTESIQLVKDLKFNKWVNPASRAIWFEFTIYNLNLGLYAVCRITFEISPVGRWLKTFDVDILDQRHLKPLGDKGLMAWVLLVMEGVLVMFVIRYLSEEMSEFLACDNGHSKIPCLRIRVKWDYFADGWNILDWTNLILMVVVMYYRVSNWGISGDIQLAIGTSLNALDYANLHDVVQNVRLIRQLTAFNAVLTWFKAVKYISILPYITTFMEVMALSWQMLVGLAAIFITSFMGFCLSYSTAFGQSISDFRTVPRAFVFLMRCFVGNADMSAVYDANPVIGSMLILLFVIGMIFVNINLFYAIIISYMSDARQSCEMEQAKTLAKFQDKIVGFIESITRVLQLGARFRGCFPGLWSRMKTWDKNKAILEAKRDARMAERAKLLMPHENLEDALGSANPSCGRRKKRKWKTELDDGDDEDAKSDPESEPDLGPLRFVQQLDPPDHSQYDEHHHEHHHELEDEHNEKPPPPPRPPVDLSQFGIPVEAEVPDRDQEVKDLVMDATEHVVKTIKERCKGARNLVIGEMSEARNVLQGIGNVLDVLGRRARSLEAQQEQILPPEVVARVKAARDEAEEAFDY